MKDEKNKNILIISLILLVVLLTLLLCILLFKNKSNNNDNKVNKENVITEEITLKGLKFDKTDYYKNTLDIYYSKNETEFCYYEDDEDCSSKKISIKVESKEAKKLDVYEEEFVFYKDNNKIKMYDYKKNKSYVINIDSDYNEYEFKIDNVTGELSGIIYTLKEDDYPSYYSVIDDKKLYEKKYRQLDFLSKDYLSSKTYTCEKSDTKFVEYDNCTQETLKLLSAKEEKVIKSENVIKDDDGYFDEQVFGIFYNKNGTYFYHGEFLDAEVYNSIYTEDLKKIASNSNEFDAGIGTDGNLYINQKGVVNVYDNDGKKIKTSKKYDIQRIIGEYIVAIKDNNLILATVDSEEIKLTSWNKKNNALHVALSGWYTENGKNGIYLVVEDSKANKDDVWEYCKTHNYCNGDILSKKDLDDYNLGYEYYYIPETKEKGKIPTFIGGYAKPILYLYPEKETKVKITFNNPNSLTTTYPKYENYWLVNAHPNGDLYDLYNKYYYALYWEENPNHKIAFKEGFYVTSDEAISFLEEKLSYIGLNDRERNEFIMYWLPILEKNEKNIIYFELTKERERYSKINITPKPDSLLRISMHVKKVNEKPNIKNQKLTRFIRKGFTAVEWGGLLHK